MEKEKYKKIESKIALDIAKTEKKVEVHEITQYEADKKIEKEIKEDISKIDSSSTEKSEKNKKAKHIKKTEAIVNGRNLPISIKHSIALCNLIRNKDIDRAIDLLKESEERKKPVPMKGEMPHKKGMMSGKFPAKAMKEFIILLKSLRANALINELELEKYKIYCKSNVAPRPYKRFGEGRFKRAHVQIKLIDLKNTK